MDNLAPRKVTGVRDSIKAIGTQRLYLPPYSPNFNPSKGDSPSLRLPYAVSISTFVDKLIQSTFCKSDV